MKPLALVFAVLCLWFSAATAQENVKINPAITHGTWEGWGTSLCWMGNVFGNREDLADVLFTRKTVAIAGRKLPGLGLNIVRYNLGACSGNEIDGRKMVVSKIIKKYRQMEGFWLDGKNADPQSSSWNWNADARQRAMLRKARDRGADHFELFSNSPMWWMTAHDNPSGGAKPSDDNLPEKNYAAFATYLATVARVARSQWGIEFTTISPFNEPMSDWWFADCKQEGCHFSHAAQARFLPILRAELNRQGLTDLPISASEETFYDHAVSTWKSFPPEIKALIPQVNVHGYQLGNGNRELLHRLVVVRDGRKLWNSEHGDKDGSGLELARNLHRDMHRLHPTAWSYWQPTDGGGWGMLNSDLEKADIKSVNPKFYVFAQYARHIRPGMVILESGHANTVAAYDAEAQRLILVTLNDGPARNLSFELTRFKIPDSAVSSVRTQPFQSVYYEKQPDISLKDRRLEVSLPGNTIQTFEIRNVAPQLY